MKTLSILAFGVGCLILGYVIGQNGKDDVFCISVKEPNAPVIELDVVSRIDIKNTNADSQGGDWKLIVMRGDSSEVLYARPKAR